MTPHGAALWHRHAWIAYAAIFVGVIGHATTEFVAVLSGVAGPTSREKNASATV